MTEIEKNEYKKAYVELNEIIKLLSNEEKQKIPDVFIKNLREDMDTNYEFKLDNNKNVLEQQLRIETKALLVELYENYLANEEEKNFWNNYDKICINMIEKQKQKKYRIENIFGNRKNEKENTEVDDASYNNLPIEIQNKGILKKFVNYIKRLFHLN